MGQFPLLADRHKSAPQLVGRRRGEDKSARVNADDGIHRAGRKVFRQMIYGRGKEAGVGQHRRNVLELDPRLRKIRHIAERSGDLLDACAFSRHADDNKARR